MNPHNARKLADFIEKELKDIPPDCNEEESFIGLKGNYFNMNSYIDKIYGVENEFTYHCGTTACIAGSVVLLESLKNDNGVFLVKGTSNAYQQSIRKLASEFLDLNENEEDLLFSPPSYLGMVRKRHIYADQIKKNHAVYVLRKFAEEYDQTKYGILFPDIVQTLWLEAFRKLGV